VKERLPLEHTFKQVWLGSK